MCDTTGEYERSLSHFCFNDSVTYCKLHELHKCVSNLKRNQGSSYKEVNATHILKNPWTFCSLCKFKLNLKCQVLSENSTLCIYSSYQRGMWWGSARSSSVLKVTKFTFQSSVGIIAGPFFLLRLSACSYWAAHAVLHRTSIDQPIEE